MDTSAGGFRLFAVHQPYPSWSVLLPMTFTVDPAEDESSWMAYDDHRSVSLTSILLEDPLTGPVTQAEFLAAMDGPDASGGHATVSPLGGVPEDPPPGLAGRAWFVDVPQPSRARRAISGVLIGAAGRILVATVTGDDEAWTRETWNSITFHADAEPRVRAADGAGDVSWRPGVRPNRAARRSARGAVRVH